jgi:hypothetical protein
MMIVLYMLHSLRSNPEEMFQTKTLTDCATIKESRRIMTEKESPSITEWRTVICSRKNCLSGHCCFSIMCSCCSYGVLAHELHDLESGLKSNSKTAGCFGTDCVAQLAMIQFFGLPCPLLCAKRCEIRKNWIGDHSRCGDVKDCVYSWTCYPCSNSQVRSTQHTRSSTPLCEFR